MNENPLVYSTDPNEQPSPDPKPQSTGQAGKPTGRQTVTVSCSRKGRGGKTVTLVSGLRHCPEAMERLAQRLKQLCGCGGTVKGGEILIQGDQRERVAAALEAEGYTVRRSGG